MKNLLFLFSGLLLLSCQNEPHSGVGEVGEYADFKKDVPEVKEMEVISDTILTRKDYTDRSGSAGIFQVDKMLALTVSDSADETNIAKKYAEAFAKLEMDVKELGIKPFGAPGVITYNDDPKNTLFECLYPIDSIPKKRPKYSRVAIIRAENMLIYNHYGSYGELPNSYQKIMKLMIKNNLLKSGPLREFYVTDPSKEKDESKWLVRIMIPVMKKDTLKKAAVGSSTKQVQ